jgi:hypothetical protein
MKHAKKEESTAHIVGGGVRGWGSKQYKQQGSQDVDFVRNFELDVVIIRTSKT